MVWISNHSHEITVSDVPAPAWPGFRRLGLEEIVNRAKSQKLGLAWLGLALGVLSRIASFEHSIGYFFYPAFR